jgi:hypothetical protein
MFELATTDAASHMVSYHQAVDQAICQAKQSLNVVMDRTQWQDHNLFMVSLVYQNRAISLY